MNRLIVLISLTLPLISVAQSPFLSNTYHRTTHSLDGEWQYIVDPYENGYYNYRYEAYDQMDRPSASAYFMDAKSKSKSDLLEYNFDQASTLKVPGDWNSQDEHLLLYEGTVWYRKLFDAPKTENKGRLFLYFGAVNYHAEIYLNGEKLGEHTGGFTPFQFEVIKPLKAEKNSLVVKVNNQRVASGVPNLNTDWWNYGGITRSVKLVETPLTYVEDYQLQLAPDNPNKLVGYIQLSGKYPGNQSVDVSIEEADWSHTFQTDPQGMIIVDLTLDKELKLWSPQDPYRYAVTLKVKDDLLTDHIGFRTITTDSSKIMLNGAPVFLKGISLHEEKAGGGRVQTKEDAKKLLSWVKELGCNYIRLAHYPHNEHIIQLADEMGILVWEEIPVYWTIEWENKETYLLAEQQLSEMIHRDKNRAAVIIWSMANETPTSTPRNQFLNKLAERARKIDPTRLISAALEQSSVEEQEHTRTISDPFASVVDVLSFNQYIGWYDGLPEKCRKINWQIPYEKPVIVSEFGGGAKFGTRGDSLTRWTEDFQAYLYEETLEMLDRIPQLQGFSPWVLMDFRSPRRPLPGIQDGWNRKGLISEQGEKKAAFFVLQAFYNQKD